jgi:uncharacterized SAM-binding protein YcdF (DUF218 family)
MGAADSQADDRAGKGPRGSRALRFLKLAALVVVCAIVIFAAGFGIFLLRVPTEEVALRRNADGIVVLTGGASRIEDAVELLANGRGQRLLITGVHRLTSEREIKRLKPGYGKIFACCVDLDRSALNTIGNATETRRWVQERGFKSLIVVTSNYHMPRAMAELRHQLPDIALIPFPVVGDQLRASWSNGPTLRLLFWEYVKYTVAVGRMLLPFQII